MKREALLALLTLFILSGCTPATDESGSRDDDDDDRTASTYESDDDTPTTQPSNNTTTTPSYTISYHNQGLDCLSCHAAPARNADGEDFLSGGTIYTKLDGSQSSDFAYGYSIRLALSNGQSVDYKTKSSRGTGNAYSEDSRLLSYAFTAQVINASGVVVNSSMTNSHDSTRLACNTCHTSSGANGAPGRIAITSSLTTPTDSNTTTTTPPTTDTNTMTPAGTTLFATDVLPILENNCKVCHGSNGRLSITDAATTYTNIMSFNGIDTATPENSLLLTKASGVSHGGGTILLSTSTHYATIRDWIAQGAIGPDGTPTTPTTTTPVTTPTPTTTPTFAANVLPLLNACTGCHGSSVTSYTNVMNFGAIDIANPTSSLLLLKASNTTAHSGGAVYGTTTSAYTTIRDWIAAGAQNN